MLSKSIGNRFVWTVTVVGIAAAAAMGQAYGQPENKPALGGPAVKDREVPGVRDAFAEGEAGKFMRAERMPFPVFVDALKVLTDDAAPADVRATAEQESAVRALVEKFRQDQREFQAAHRDDLRRIREQGGGDSKRPARRGDAPSGSPASGQDDAMTAGETPSDDMRARRMAAAEKMKEIERDSPRVEDLYTKVWEQLTDPQRKAVDQKLDVWRQERSKEREDSYVRQRMAKKGDAPAPKLTDKAPAGQPAPRRPLAAGDEPARAERRQRLMKLFEQLPAEEQDRILDRLEQRLRDGGGLVPEGRRGGAAPGGAAKPAPSVDRVRVPSPDGTAPDPAKKDG